MEKNKCPKLGRRPKDCYKYGTTKHLQADYPEAIWDRKRKILRRSPSPLTMRATSPRNNSPISTGSADNSEITHDSSMHVESVRQGSLNDNSMPSSPTTAPVALNNSFEALNIVASSMPGVTPTCDPNQDEDKVMPDLALSSHPEVQDVTLVIDAEVAPSSPPGSSAHVSSSAKNTSRSKITRSGRNYIFINYFL